MTNLDKICIALMKTHPTTTYANSTNGETYASFVWVDNAITEAEFDSALAAYDALEYSRLRKAKYDLLNQDEMRYDDVKNSTTTWVDAIDAIKAAHPKP